VNTSPAGTKKELLSLYF